MKVLVINCGSSSVKYQFIDLETEEVIVRGIVEKIGEDISFFTFTSKDFIKKKEKIRVKNHEKAINIIIEALLDKEDGVIQTKSGIDAVGHRLVHAGEHYSGSVIIDDRVLRVMKECVPLAPLHNPANIKGIEAMNNVLPKIPQCGVFDTAFHQTIPPKAYLYALPFQFYMKDKIRRYGFHGTSHKYVSRFAAEYLKKDIKDLKIITCHLGNGASITAIQSGKSVDTSMGFTPLEGLMMGTRCGDIDPAIPIYLMKEKGMGPDLVNIILNKKSGMIGLSEISNDMRVIEEKILKKHNPKAILAHEVYAYKIKKYIGSYTAVMNGLDVLVFTGGVGENMPLLRQLVCENLDYLGIKLDKNKNDRLKAGILELQAMDSKVKVLKIPTNEELMIAMETRKLLSEN